MPETAEYNSFHLPLKEGPQVKLGIEISWTEYCDVPISQRELWVYNTIITKLPDGELKDALILSTQEKKARDESENRGAFRQGFLALKNMLSVAIFENQMVLH